MESQNLLKQGHLAYLAQEHIQAAFEYLEGGELHNLSGQPNSLYQNSITFPVNKCFIFNS